MKQFDAVILENRDLAGQCFEVFFTWPELRAPLPGQFVTVGARSGPFLRQPYPIASFNRKSGTASIIFNPADAIGPFLAELARGDSLDLLGPRGFPFQTGQVGKPDGTRPLLVSTGAGLGALVFAANSLAEKGFRPELILGYAQTLDVPGFELDSAVRLISCAGLQYLDTLSETELAGAFVWAGGPRERLAGVHEWAVSRGLPCLVRLEIVMACAVGACQGCTVATTDDRQFVRVCTEGPVFPSEVIQWT